MARDVGAILTRALGTAAQRAGCPIDITDNAWRRWASATFSGARHQLSLSAFPSPALDGWIGGLAETNLAMPGHFVADLNVVAVRRGGARIEADLEILTVELS